MSHLQLARERPVKPIFDTAWRQKALCGDSVAIRTLAEAALEPLYAFCYYRLGCDRSLCEEVVQETVLRALRDLEKYDPERAGGHIFGWLTGLARNEIRRTLASRKAISLEVLWARMDTVLKGIYAQLDSSPFSDEVLEREETKQMVNATMSQLPPHYREALERKYVNGQSVRDIAAAVETTEKAVESLLTRARGAFRDTFLTLTSNLNLETC